jgi:hypothetical protein
MKKVKKRIISKSSEPVNPFTETNPSEEYSDYCDYDNGELGRLFASIWNQGLAKDENS